ncbi:O-antigen ligase family protein [Halocatena salina]|uniref:O-antigen ligase domain-containing protein n=1 Tax=Halocatena salina TaxID=2934340 RepID=A0A8U0A7Q0_9EURY|nr:hypothetical protein [Halocatena salina]UPM43937.1 hypothetical protein MW046_05710 [Halocatena salina]
MTNVPILSAISSPPQTVDRNKFFLTAFCLAGLLVVGVPVVALTTGVPVLLLVGISGLCYLFVLVGTDSVFEGLCSAIIVLTTFAANVPLYELPVGSGKTVVLNVMLVDMVLLPFLVLLGVWTLSGRLKWPSFSSLSRLQAVAVFSLAGFVLWSFLAGIVGNGPSRAAGLVFAVTQLRHLSLFIVAIIIVRFSGISTAIYSMLIAISFQLLFAVVQTLNRVWFGLSYLGEGSGTKQGLIHLGPVSFMTGQFAGGFTSTSRILVAILILMTPVLVEVIINRSSVWKVLSAIALFCSALLIRISGTDAGFGAFGIVIGSISAVGVYLAVRELSTGGVTAVRDSVLGVASSMGAGAFNVVLFTMRSATIQDDSDSGPSGVPGGSWESGSGTRQLSHEEQIIELIGNVPLVSTANVSVRVKQYLGAVDLGLQYPLFGIGGHNFLWMAQSYGIHEPKSIHNIYLMTLASGGVPAAITFVMCLIAILGCAAKQGLSSDESQTLWAALVCGLLGFYAYAFWTAIHASGSVALMVFWTVAGFVVGATMQGRSSVPPSGRSDRQGSISK